MKQPKNVVYFNNQENYQTQTFHLIVVIVGVIVVIIQYQHY